jgi:hypothetical protein
MGSVFTECLQVKVDRRHLQSSTSLVRSTATTKRRDQHCWCDLVPRISRRRLWPRRRASSRSTPSRCARQLSLRVMLCRTSATCQRDDEYEPLANPEQLRVRGRLRKSRVIAALQHFAARAGALASAAPTGVLLGGSTLHSLFGSQRAAKSAVNVDEDDGRAGARQKLSRPCSRCCGCSSWCRRRCWPRSTSACALLADLAGARRRHPSHRARCCVRLPSVPFAVARVCILSAMTTAQHVDDLILATQRAMERIR